MYNFHVKVGNAVRKNLGQGNSRTTSKMTDNHSYYGYVTHYKLMVLITCMTKEKIWQSVSGRIQTQTEILESEQSSQ